MVEGLTGAGEAEEVRHKFFGREGTTVEPRETIIKSTVKENPVEESDHELAAIIVTKEESWCRGRVR